MEEDPGYLVWCYENAKNQTIVTERIYQKAKEQTQQMQPTKKITREHGSDKFIDYQLDNYCVGCMGDDF